MAGKMFSNVLEKIRKEQPRAEDEIIESETPKKTYELEYRTCRGALDQIQELSDLSKIATAEEGTVDALAYRTRLEIIKSLSNVILGMVKDLEDKK